MRRALFALAGFFAGWLLMETLATHASPKGESYLRTYLIPYLAGGAGFTLGLVLVSVTRWKRDLVPVLFALLGVLGFSVATFRGGYHWEAREMRRLLTELEGVEIVDINGNHDLTLEGIWLDLRVSGESVYLSVVHARDFGRADHLRVSFLGPWYLRMHGHRQGKPELECDGGGIDVGRKGEFAEFVSPPFENVPDLLARLDELHAVVERIPEDEPGLRRENERYVLFYTKEPAE